VKSSLSGLVADARYSLRSFRKTPGLTAATVLTLAIGLGATTTIFSVVNGVLLKPLPYANPDRLVQIVENVPAGEGFGGTAMRRSSLNVSELDWWRTHSTALSDVALIRPESSTLDTADGTVQLSGARVSPALFPMRGVAPVLGRGLLPDEERPDADSVVLAESTWQKYFRGDPNILGRTIRLDGNAFTVVGVMPPEFGKDAFWTALYPAPLAPGQVMFLGASARLRDGVSLAAASAEANAIGLQLRGIEAEPGQAPRFEIVPELDQLTAAIRPALNVLVVSVAAVLLIVCANVANLLLVRGTRRQQDIAIRRSLGATRGRIMRQVLTESFLLSAGAGLIGIAIAYGAVGLLKSLASVDLPRRFSFGAAILPRLEDIAVDPAVLGFVLALTIVTSVAFGVLPALRLSRFGEQGHHAAGQLSAATANTRVGHVLATVQIACALALMIGAGLLMHSFLKLAATNPGFDARGVLSFDLVVPGDSTPEHKIEVAQTLAARLEQLPQVTGAGFTDVPPLSAGIIVLLGGFVPEGMTEAELREEQRGLPPREITQSRNVSADYLRALGARLVDGHWFESEPGARLEALVSSPYAQHYFPSRSAVGATLHNNLGTFTIVGVVDDIRLGGLDVAPERIVFTNPRQVLAAQRALQPNMPPQMARMFLTLGGSGIAFAARTTGDPLAILPTLTGIARDIDPGLAIDAVTPMESVLAGITTRPRFYAVLLSAFGAAAGFIAIIGIYGVLAYLVSLRTKEIGIRMALGAQHAAVMRLVLRRGAAMVAIGVAIGVTGAAALTRYLESMLFGLSALDASTYAVVAAAFAGIALLACYLPARRATRVDPLDALRCE
jgi:putative ABC transport system permease protein